MRVRYNMRMYRLSVMAVTFVLFVACNNKPAPAPAASSTPATAASQAPASEPAAAAPSATSTEVDRKLQEVAGNGATNCGAVASMAQDELSKASDCAMNAAKNKKPFTVSYAMPGLTVGVAGNAAGKLFSVQSEMDNGREVAPKVEPCPAALRVAQSGRVTCMQAGTMGVKPGSGNPHGQNPHGMGMPAPGTPNPHQPSGPKASH